jgi:hypothetical protein
MVFGSCYCAVSRLEIKDGDKCILIPLGFHLGGDFAKYEKPDVNTFFWLYTFVPVAPQVVIFGGNCAEIEYLDKRYKQVQEHEMYMLIHFGFWKSLQANHMAHVKEWSMSGLSSFDTFRYVWMKAMELSDEVRNKEIIEFVKAKAAGGEPEFSANYMNGGPAPAWMVELHKLGTFMGQMGIMATPNICSDQHEMGKDFEKLVKEAKSYDKSLVSAKKLFFATTGNWPTKEEDPKFYSDENYREKYLSDSFKKSTK